MIKGMTRREYMREYTRAYREKNSAQLRRYDRDRYKDPRRRQAKRESNLRWLYGITPEEWNQLFERQGRSCAICRGGTSGSKLGWTVDHDHVTGQVRGILCHPCNHGLGRFKDDVDRLQAAIDYLRSPKRGPTQRIP